MYLSGSNSGNRRQRAEGYEGFGERSEARVPLSWLFRIGWLSVDNPSRK